MKRKTKTLRQLEAEGLCMLFPSCLILCMAFCHAGRIAAVDRLAAIRIVCAFFMLPLGVMAAFWAFRNQVDKGVKYMWKHHKIISRLERQLLEAGVYTVKDRLFGTVKTAETPWAVAHFAPDFRSGTVYIKNSIKFHDRLGRMDISPSLGKYAVEQSYLTDDGNYYCFAFYDACLDRRLAFGSFREFQAYSGSVGEYELFIDKDIALPLTHQLLAGQTGSGKSYALLGYILQMQGKPVPYHLYFADPKSSSVALLGGRISPDATADSFDGIVALLETFVSEMGKRQEEMKRRLSQKIDGDYRDFGLPPHVMVVDEFADFSLFLQTKDKKQRDHVNSLIASIVLKGRQSGFFLWVVMQQAGSNNIPTFIRDNLPWKVVLGNAEEQTYVTAFGAGADIPMRKLGVGEGVFTYPGVADKPRLCSFPTLGFDILQGLEAGVM